MKLTFLGTGAADWNINSYDAMPFFRRNSSALIDGTLLIDPGPHVFHFAEKMRKPIHESCVFHAVMRKNIF